MSKLYLQQQVEALEAELASLFTAQNIDLLSFLNAEAFEGVALINLEDLELGILNNRFWQLLGHGQHPVSRHNNAWLALMLEEDAVVVKHQLHLCQADEKQRFDQLIRFRHLDGNVLTLRCKGFFIRNKQGIATRMVGFHTDLSKERHKELLLTETNRAARVGSWEYNIPSGELYWSEVTKEIHEVPQDFEAKVEQGVSFYREGYSRTRITEVLAKAVAEGTPWDEVLQLVTAKGNIIWVRAVGQATKANGKVVRLFGAFQDVNDKTLKELELQEKEELLRQNFELAPNGMVITDASGKLERVSKSFCEMLGYSREELSSMTLRSITHPDHIDSNIAMMQGFVDGLFDSYRGEKQYITKDGSIVWADVSIAVLRDLEKKPTHYHVQLVDITQSKLAESRRQRIALLEDKAKEMEQFAYIASHDLRQPVLTIQGYLTALMEDFGPSLNAEGQGYIHVMQNALTRMDEMMKGLLDYSRLSKMKQLQEVDLDEILKNVLEDLTSQIAATNATIELGALGKIIGYPVELRQLFQNLISNALRYHKPGIPPKVTVAVTKIAGGHKFSVKDNGIGIGKESQQRIFGLFQTAGKTNQSGTGIGLASCRTIVERHGGTIWVESKFDKGSTFYFTIQTEE